MALTAKQLKLDYFKVYDVDSALVQQKVALQGQFDKVAEGAQVHYLRNFSNAVSKNGEPIYNKNAHLAWYRIEEDLTEPTREIVIDNQFVQKQTLVIGRAEFLLAPAWKHEPGSAPPKGLDHFKLYQVLEGPAVNKTVKLVDQFGSQEAKVGHPLFFGTPVKKFHGGATVDIVNRKAHLLVYAITPGAMPRTAEYSDQFLHKRLHVLRSTWLAAPTLKLSWKQI